VRWVADESGFRFDGLPKGALPDSWLFPETRVATRPVLVLGPEPIIGPQAVVLTSEAQPRHRVRVATDGLRPFSVTAESGS